MCLLSFPAVCSVASIVGFDGRFDFSRTTTHNTSEVEQIKHNRNSVRVQRRISFKNLLNI